MRSSTSSQGAPPAGSASASASRRSRSATCSSASGNGSRSHSAAMLSQSSSTSSPLGKRQLAELVAEVGLRHAEDGAAKPRERQAQGHGPRHPDGRGSAAAWYLERLRECSDSEAGRSVIVQSDRDADELDERVGSDRRRTTLRKQDKGRRNLRKPPPLLGNPMEHPRYDGGFLRQRLRGAFGGRAQAADESH